ncbi:MAG TPA: hypothetical protein VN752_04545, partial [Solirubrobacterales bacterium]|nr:hypothetical protein [Solirubrobacterales bacterium]
GGEREVSKQLIAVVAGALALVVLVAGCGGGDDAEGEVTTASISKAEFAKQADAVCKEGEKQVEKDFSVYLKEHEDITKPTEEDYAELVEVVLAPHVEEEIDGIRELGAPAGDEDQVEELLEAREESLEAAKEEPELVVTDSTKVFGEWRKLAQTYGLEACGIR